MPSSPLAFMVAGTRSGSGKTTLALSLMAALHRRGLTVQAFKAGPDFIDPGHHAALTRRPSSNLDTWMAGDEGVRTAWRRLLHSQPQPDVIVGEGVMGLFDGAGGVEASDMLGGRGSTAHLARLLHLPLLLVVDVRGMAQSAAAVALGFTSLQPELNFAGIVCTHVGGPSHEALLREAFQTVLGQRIPLLGLMPRQGAPELRSRHLGLVMAHEVAWDAQRESMACWVEQHMDVDALLVRCAEVSSHGSGMSGSPTTSPTAQPVLSDTPSPPNPSCPSSQGRAGNQGRAGRPRIGIARDEAFCFLYAHMPEVLQELGADCVFFSPLHDAQLPEHCDTLYFPGGYPELHGQTISGNTKMLTAVRSFATSGRRVYGECGGYIYLMESVEVQGKVWPMSGCLPLRCRLEESRTALGYREVTMRDGTGPLGRGHEFHYARLLTQPTAPPLWQVRDRTGKPLSDEGVRQGNICASWVHLCPYGGRALLAHLFQLPTPEEHHAP